jgi:uncharacterized protein YifN (PemK superfamily)
MSYDEGQILSGPEEVDPRDVVIEDPQLVAGVGSPAASVRESNETSASSFYHTVIVICANRIRQEHPQQIHWTKHQLVDAASRMVDSITNERGGRFVWLKQLPVRQHVVLSRAKAIDKIANDLTVQMRKAMTHQQTQALKVASQTSVSNLSSSLVEAERKPEEKSSSPPASTSIDAGSENLQMKYAVQLILSVIKASQDGLDPASAARVLDKPRLEFRSASSRVLPPGKETHREQKLRLLLRHRYLALARCHGSVHNFSKALLEGYGISLDIELKKKRRADRKMKNCKSPPVKGSLKFQQRGKNGPQPGLPGDAPPSSSKPQKLTGSWFAHEKMAFLAAMKKYGCGSFTQYLPMIPTR